MGVVSTLQTGRQCLKAKIVCFQLCLLHTNDAHVVLVSGAVIGKATPRRPVPNMSATEPGPVADMSDMT